MSLQINYKNLLNSFIDNGKSYTLDVKDRLSKLFLYHNMGCVEEIMVSRNYNNGTFGVTPVNLVGIPNDIVGRVTGYHTTLKNSISTETTSIQTQLNLTSPTNNEKEYIKQVLHTTLDSQFSLIMNNLLTTVNSFRDLQNNLVSNSDQLNLITISNLDGNYINRNGGAVRVFSLTGMSSTVGVQFTSDYNTYSSYITNYITTYVNPTFTKNYPTGNEYFFFVDKMYTKELLDVKFTNNYVLQLTELLKYRESELYDNLLKVDPKGINGITDRVRREFKPKLDVLLKPWVKYDINLMNERFRDNVETGFEVLKGELTNFKNDIKIDYGIVTGTTQQTLLRDNLRDRERGTTTSDFNLKLPVQLYVS